MYKKMLKHTWVIIFGIFYTAAATITFGKLNGKDKSVNLALETVFEFGEDDKKADVNILNKVQKFIGKVKNVIENSNGLRRHVPEDNKNRFTNFIVDGIRILKEYDDRDLEKFAIIVSDEMNNRHYKGSQFHDLTKSLGIQDTVVNKLVEIKKKPAIDIRNYLKGVANKINKENYLKSEKRLLDAINSVYTADSSIKLNTFLTNLNDFRSKARKNMDLSKIISQGLNSIFFDYYSNLSPNLRTSLVSDLNNIFNHLFNGFENVGKNIVYEKPVTKTTNSLRTSRQMYYEKDLDMKYIQSAFKKWISEEANKEGRSKDKIDNTRTVISRERSKYSTQWIPRGKNTDKSRTPIIQRLLHVPTTRKLSSEYENNALRSHKSSKRDKKYRFSEVSDEESTPRYKKRRIETTKEYRTLRQMYVEKNIDLKYDPDAYENLTTANKYRTKKKSSVNSPTTRKIVKNTYEEEEEDSYESYSEQKQTKKLRNAKKPKTDDDSYEAGLKPNKKEKVAKSILSDFIIELSTEVHAPSITKLPKIKLTKLETYFGEPLLDKKIDYAYDMTPELRSNSKKMTFATLYPSFINDWSTTQPRVVKRKFLTPAPDYRVRKLKHTKDREAHTHESGNRGVKKDSRKNENLDYSVEVRKEKYLERSRRNKQNYRNRAEYNSKDYSKVSRIHLGKTTKRNHGNVPVLRQDRESLSGKIKMSRAPLILAKQYWGSHNVGKKQFRRYNLQAPIISEEGLSIEAKDDKNIKKSNRRHDNPNTDFKIGGNRQVLRRLMKLENELEIVKTQIRNDTNAVKDLIKNSRNAELNKNEFSTLHSDSLKVAQLQKVITGLNSKPDLDTVTQLKSISGSGFNMAIPEAILTKDKEFTEKKYDSYRDPHENPSKNNNTIDELPLKAIQISKGEYTQNVNKIEQGRKAFPNTKKTEEVKPDELKVYDKPSNFDSKNNTPKKSIETMSVTSKIKEASDISESYKGSLKDRQDRAPYFRTNDDELDATTFNVTAHETLKDKYGFNVNQINNNTVLNQTETKELNSEATITFKEGQFNEDSQTKANFTKVDLDNHVANLAQLNSSKEFKRDDKVDNSRIAFRASINDIPDMTSTTQGANLTTKQDDLSKLNIDSITSSNVASETNITTAIPDPLMKKLIKEIGGAALPNTNTGNVVQGSVVKEPGDVHMLVNMIKSGGIENKTLQQQQYLLSPNVQLPTNVSITN